MYALLEKYGNQNLAIRYARKLSEEIKGEAFANYNPITEVYKLVEELNGKSEKLNSLSLKSHFLKIF